MSASLKSIVDAGQIGKWVKASPEEVAAIVESMGEQNLLRNIPPKQAPNYRHFVRDGYISITEGGDTEEHPTDAAAKQATAK
ncbi:MAG TPA: hypothetical protein VN921_01550 [Chthoniobacterales bacterium]|nr:hypothetical protein [Chthoniobacterales bacterium]